MNTNSLDEYTRDFIKDYRMHRKRVIIHFLHTKSKLIVHAANPDAEQINNAIISLTTEHATRAQQQPINNFKRVKISTPDVFYNI